MVDGKAKRMKHHRQIEVKRDGDRCLDLHAVKHISSLFQFV
jgi:hypothetical protein